MFYYSGPEKNLPIWSSSTRIQLQIPRLWARVPGPQMFRNRCSYHKKVGKSWKHVPIILKCGSTVYRPQRNLGIRLKPNWTSRGVRKDFSGSHALRRLPITHYQLSGTRIHMFSDVFSTWWGPALSEFECPFRKVGGVHCSTKMQPGIMLWYPMVCYGTLWYAHVFTSRVTTSSRVPSLENQSTTAINSLSMLENKTHLKVKINYLVVPQKIKHHLRCLVSPWHPYRSSWSKPGEWQILSKNTRVLLLVSCPCQVRLQYSSSSLS